jgi:hypothetical protein
VAALATAMKARSEGDRTLLDNAVVFWCRECAMGNNHSFNNARAVLLGSCGGVFKTGQHVKLGGASHGRLFVTLMNALEIDVQQFGDPKHGTGPLAGLT